MNPEQPDAVALGGPLDGQVLGRVAADHVDVTMADRMRHRYVRGPPDEDSVHGIAEEYAGRLR